MPVSDRRGGCCVTTGGLVVSVPPRASNALVEGGLFLVVDDTSLLAMPTQIRADASQQSSWLRDAFHQMRIISSSPCRTAVVAGLRGLHMNGLGVQIPCRADFVDLRVVACYVRVCRLRGCPSRGANGRGCPRYAPVRCFRRDLPLCATVRGLLRHGCRIPRSAAAPPSLP